MDQQHCLSYTTPPTRHAPQASLLHDGSILRRPAPPVSALRIAVDWHPLNLHPRSGAHFLLCGCWCGVWALRGDLLLVQSIGGLDALALSFETRNMVTLVHLLEVGCLVMLTQKMLGLMRSCVTRKSRSDIVEIIADFIISSARISG